MGYLGRRIQIAFEQMLDNLVAKIPDILTALITLLIFYIAAWIIKRVTRSALTRVGFDWGISTLIVRVAYYITLIVGVLEALSQLKVNLAALGLGIGVIGFAIGFALRDILSNFLAGVLILWTRHFRLGDQIIIQNYEGTIEAIELRGTSIVTYDGRRVIIPNSEVYTNAVTINTAYKYRRSSITFTLSNEVDLIKAEEVIRSALASVPNVTTDPPPDILIRELGNFSVTVEIRIWTPTRQLEVLVTNSEAAKAVKRALSANGMSIAFTTQVVQFQPPDADQSSLLP